MDSRRPWSDSRGVLWVAACVDSNHAAWITAAAAWCYAGRGPEDPLVPAQTRADFPRVHESKEFHGRSAAAEIWQCLCHQHGACQGRNAPPAGAGRVRRVLTLVENLR